MPSLRENGVALRNNNTHKDMLAGIVTLTIIATIAVLLRLYAQHANGKKMWYDAYALLFGWFLAFGCTICASIMFTHGSGEHLSVIKATNPDPLPVLMTYSKASFALTLLWSQSLFWVKLSLLLFYQQMFVADKPSRIHLVTQVLIAYLVCVAIICFLNQLLLCLPVRYFWDIWYIFLDRASPTQGTCPFISIRGLTLAILNLLSDILILLLPLVSLKKLHLARGKKMMLAGVFSLGSMCAVLTVAKIPYLLKSGTSRDSTWDNAYAMLFLALEPNGGVVCACLPFIPTIFHKRRLEANLSQGCPNDFFGKFSNLTSNAPTSPTKTAADRECGTKSLVEQSHLPVSN